MPTFSTSDIIVACVALAAILVLVLYILISGRRSNKQLLASLQRSFAKPPVHPAQEDDMLAYYNASIMAITRAGNSVQEAPAHAQRRIIDNQTWDDLEMSQIFLRLDACQSSAGDECLYARLHDLNAAANDADAVEEIITLCKANPDLRLKLQFLLASAGKQAGNGLGVLIFELVEKYHARHHIKQHTDDKVNVSANALGGGAASDGTGDSGGRAKSDGTGGSGGKAKSAKHFSTLLKRYVYVILSVLPIIMIPVCVLAPILGLPAVITALVVNGLVHYQSERNNVRDYQSLRYLSALLWSTKKILALLSDNDLDNNLNSDLDNDLDNDSANSAKSASAKGAENPTNNSAKPKKRDISQNPLIKSLAKSYPVFARAGGAISGAVQRNSWYTEAELLREFYEIFFLARVRHYNRAMHILKANHELLHLLYHSFGTLDVAIAIYSFRESLPYYALPKFCAPVANKSEACYVEKCTPCDTSHTQTRTVSAADDSCCAQTSEPGASRNMQLNNMLQASDLYHPLVHNPVANSVNLAHGNLITGSNASGKSTFIKAIGVNAILAQTINTCTAKSLQMQPMLVISAMAARDSVLTKESYFIAETRALKRLVDATYAHPCLCLIDEILRGTNTTERIAASAAILKNLVASTREQSLKSVVLAATHDLELVDLLGDNYKNYHFDEIVGSDTVEFDYLIKDGKATGKNAIKLLALLGFEASIVNGANDIAERYQDD
ncbi:MAG: hypothetical protein LBG97_01550 [Coriobacteriales bacterium]|jgi:hypothetical protein|nr:hypothetical protein [Coriobacteriales bacterium]